MRKKSLMKDTLREIKGSLGRFFSIMVIVALGVAFLAGIQVSAPMMRDTTDQYMDEYQLMDVMVLSTLGLESKDVEVLRTLEQVENIRGSYSIDTLVDLAGSQHVLKAHSLQALEEMDPRIINKPKLIEGRWPENDRECLIDGTSLTRLPIQIGETLTLESGTDVAIGETLINNQFTVVGIINSPYYMHFERGTAEIGNGSISSYVYIPEQNFKSDIFTEIFITLKGAKSLDTYSQIYTDLVDEFKEYAEPVIQNQADMRYERLMKEGYIELEEGEEILEEEKEKVRQELEKIAVQLQEAQGKIDEAESTLRSGESKAELGFREGEAAIGAAELSLEEKQKEYEETATLFMSYKEMMQSQLEVNAKEIEEERHQVQQVEGVLEGIREQLELVADEEKDELRIREKDLEVELTTLQANLQVSEEIYDKGIAEMAKGDEALSESKRLLERAQQELVIQKSAINLQKQVVFQELEEGWKQLNGSKLELEKGKKEYETGKLEAIEQITLAEERLIEGRDALDNLKSPNVYLLGREANYGVVNYKSAANTIDQIGDVFPIFFFIVAALVCLTTMTRMVDEGRTTIGTYKALGYSAFDIMSKYMLYAALASVIGSIIGIIVGFKVFPNTIYNAYGMAFTTPPLQSKFYPQEAIVAIVLMTGLTVFAAAFTTIKELREQPADLMRPKAPAKGKRILLERVPAIWNRMNFFQKVVARNIFRYKKKFFMTTIGIAGCTALLVAGLGLKQSVISIVGRQYEDIFTYDLEVAVKEGGIEEIEDATYIERFLEVGSENITLTKDDIKKAITLMVIEASDQVHEFISLQNRKTKEVLTLSDEGVIISEKLARSLNIQVGEYVTFQDSNLEDYNVLVTGISENYIGHYMYMSDEYAKTIKGQAFNASKILIKLNDTTESQKEKISTELTNHKKVISFVFTTKHAESFESMTSSLDTVVMILIISAGLLAFVVLYNLTTINISERYREIATIKVLGFNDFKVSQYIYRENIMLTLIGALMGAILGKVLFLFIIVTAEMEELMFSRELHLQSYVVAVLLTFIFALMVNIIMHFRLQKIEMVESLKAVE